MSQSRFCLKSYGVIELNNQTLNTNTTGTLFVNDVNVDINRVTGYTGGSGGLTFTSFNDEPENNLGGQFIVLNDSTGNVVTNTFGLNAFTDKGITTGLQAHNGNNYINFRPIGDLDIISNSGGIVLTAPQRISLRSNNDVILRGDNNIVIRSDMNQFEINNDMTIITTSELKYDCNKISLVNYNSVDQITSITTGVQLNSPFGHINTISATTSTQGTVSFNFINNIVTSNSLVQLSINDYTGSQGLPSVYVSNITTGNFNVNISNHSITDPLNGQLKLAYSIMN
jgi:hypothetical protein